MSFSSRLPESRAPGPIARALERARGESGFIDLAASNPTRAGLSPDAETLARAFAKDANARYDPDPRGLPVAREAIVARYRALAREEGRDASSLPGADGLFVTASTSEAYSWVFKLLCDPGDSVLVPKPGYPLFDLLAGLEGVRAEAYPLDYVHPRGWRVDLDALDDAFARSRARALVVIHPNNPTGSAIAEDQRHDVLALCARRGAALVADEVFRTYALDAPRARSFAGEAAVPTFVLDGLSKCLCLPQAKLGWIAVSGPGADQAMERLELVADTYLSAGAQVMNALPDLFPLEPSVRARVSARTAGNLAALRATFDGEGSPYRVLRCDAGWTAMLEFPRVESEETLALALLERELVHVHPGFFYDRPGEGAFAISLIAPEREFAEGARRLRSLLDSYCA